MKCKNCGQVIDDKDIEKYMKTKHQEALRAREFEINALNEKKKKIQDESKKQNEIIKEKEEQLKEKEKKIEELALQKARKKADIELKATKKKIEENALKNAEKQANTRAELKYEKEKKANMLEKLSLSQKVAGLQKKINQGNVELQGKVQEQLLEDFVKEQFPGDEVEVIKKGKKGGDSILHIVFQGKKVGSIYIESKDEASFKTHWAPKLLKDMKERNIGIGIIVTRVLPKNFGPKTAYIKDNVTGVLIAPFDYRILNVLLSSIRREIIGKLNSNKNVDVPREMKRVFEIMSGNIFLLYLRKKISDMNKRRENLNERKKLLDKMTDLNTEEEGISQDEEDDLKDFLRTLLKDGKINLLKETQSIEDKTDA